MPQTDTIRRLNGLTRLVGNTPLLAIDFTYRGEKRVLYAKAENLNMTGSIKDRMALHIIGRELSWRPHDPERDGTRSGGGNGVRR